MAGRQGNRAGREVAEDAKRAVRRAFRGVGLKVSMLSMTLDADRQGRFILGGAKPEGWVHELPALTVQFWVGMDGTIRPVRVFCDASDADPIASLSFGVLALKDCVCLLEDLPQVVRGVWEDRQELVARQKAGEQPRSYSGNFRWEWKTIDFSLEETQ